MVCAAAIEPPELLVDSQEAARLLSVSESTLVRLVKREGLPRVPFLRTVRWPRPLVNAVLDRARSSKAIACDHHKL